MWLSFFSFSSGQVGIKLSNILLLIFFCLEQCMKFFLLYEGPFDFRIRLPQPDENASSLKTCV